MDKLPIPEFFDAGKVGAVWRIPYEERAKQAREWALRYALQPASTDRTKTWLMLVDVQNTFCIPEFELFVGGRSGRGAVEDNTRLCEFIYRNLGGITHITATMDTHKTMQVFHAVFFVDKDGNHPAPYSDIHVADLKNDKWKFNPALAPQFGIAPEYGQQMMIHYAEELEKKGKYALTIWPYHAMLGGVGHALVASIEEALFFHSIARAAQYEIEIKGDKPFTENYSAIGRAGKIPLRRVDRLRPARRHQQHRSCAGKKGLPARRLRLPGCRPRRGGSHRGGERGVSAFR